MIDKIEQSPESGETPETQSAKLGGATQLNFLLTAAAILAAIGFGYGGTAWHLPSALVLAVLPAPLIYLVNSEPFLYAFWKPRRDPRTDLGYAFMACGLGLIIGNNGVHFVETEVLLECAGLFGLLCCTGIYSAARRNPQFWSVMFATLFIGGIYGWGVTATADSVLDKSVPASFAAMVADKHEVYHRGTSYYLDLAPWGPIKEPVNVRVPQDTYDSAVIGGQVCLELRPGSLNVHWYRLVDCDSTAQ